MRLDYSLEKRYLFLAILISVLFLIPELFVPLNGDNEVYQSMAWDLHRFGALPYIGTWDQNFPGIVYIHWLSILIFGNSVLGFRTFDLIVHACTAPIFYIILRRWVSSATALLSVALYSAFYATNLLTIAGERETFGLCILLVATFWLFRSEDTRIYTSLSALLSGILFGMMIALRPTNALFALCAFAFYWRQPFSSMRVRTGFCVGVLIPLVCLLLPYCFINGGLSQVYDSTIRYNAEIYGIAREPFATFLRRLRTYKFFDLPAMMGIYLLLFRQEKQYMQRCGIIVHAVTKNEFVLLGGYMLSALLAILVMGKYWEYHFEPFMLLLSAFSALAFLYLWNKIKTPYGRYVGAAAVVLYFYVRVVPPLRLYNTSSNDNDFLLADDIAVAQYIDRNAPPGSRFEVASTHAGVRLRAWGRSATRFTTVNCLFAKDPDGGHPAFQQEWRREYVDSLRIAKPQFIALSHVRAIECPEPVLAIHTLPGFDSEILPHYRTDTMIGKYSILQRID